MAGEQEIAEEQMQLALSKVGIRGGWWARLLGHLQPSTLDSPVWNVQCPDGKLFIGARHKQLQSDTRPTWADRDKATRDVVARMRPHA
jgi:hypothetical protein